MSPNPWLAPKCVALAGGIACALLTVAPVAAEPYPWHAGDGTSTTAPTAPSKAQVEHHEQLATATTGLTKAQIEHHEQLATATTGLTKAQIEHHEQLATSLSADAGSTS